MKIDPDDSPRSNGQVIASAILVIVLNPKLSIFFFAFLPQFIIAEDTNPLGSMVMLSLVFMAVTYTVFVVYGVFAASVRSHITAKPSILVWLRRGFAAAFVLLGAELALTER